MNALNKNNRKSVDHDLSKLIKVLEKISMRMDEANKLEEKKIKLNEKLIRIKMTQLNEKYSI